MPALRLALAVDPVCRNCGTDARLGAGAPPGARVPPAPVPPPGGPHGLRPYTPVAAPSTNGMAVASLVLGMATSPACDALRLLPS